MSSTLTNHYICPDDLSPLPTTLDAKKSPLALLAQTCSNIGADLLPNNKPIIPPLEKPKKGSMDRSESASSQNKTNSLDNRSNSASSCVDVKISFKPYETTTVSTATVATTTTTNTTITNSFNKIKKCDKDKVKDSSRSNSVDVITESNNHNNNNINTNNNKSSNSSNSNNVYSNHKKSAFHESRNQSPSGADNKSANSNAEQTSIGAIRSSPHKSSTASTTNISLSGHQQNELNPLIYSTSGITEISKSQLTPLTKSDSSKTPSSLISSMSGYNNYHNLNPSAVAAATNALQNDILKSSHYSSQLLSPYLNPAHAAAALSSLKANNVCRDPFCKGCQLSSLTGLGTNIPCANGCNGCMHPMHPHPLSGSYLHPSLSSYSSNTHSSNHLSSLRPFVCNWTVGGSYCGKTFTSCEELLQHLKTHTNGTSPFSSLGPYGFPPAALPHGLPTLPNLRSTPTHSSLDSLRYHPYKLGPSNLPGSMPPSMGPTAPAHLSSLTPGLGSLYPSYSMYNGRI